MDFVRESYRHFKAEHQINHMYDESKKKWLEYIEMSKENHVDMRDFLAFNIYFKDGYTLGIMRQHFRNVNNERGTNTSRLIMGLPLHRKDISSTKPDNRLEGVENLVLVIPRTKKNGILHEADNELGRGHFEWYKPGEAEEQFYHAPVDQFPNSFLSALNHLKLEPTSVVALNGSIGEEGIPVNVREQVIK